MIVNNVKWNLPRDVPDEPGEYLSSFEPSGHDGKMVRWWSGRNWSNPYTSEWSDVDRNRAKSQVSPIKPYWISK